MPSTMDTAAPWGRGITVATQEGPVQLILLLAGLPERPWSDSTLEALRQLAGRIDVCRELGRRPMQVISAADREVLQESASRLELTEHTAGVGSWSASVPEGVMRVSAECATILGVQGPQAIHSLDAMVACYAPEWRNGMKRRLDRCSQQGMVFDEELQVLVPEGSPKWVRSVGAPVRDGQGNIIRIQGAVQDISAQKQAQQETLRLAMRLTTTLASITEAFVTLDRECTLHLPEPGDRTAAAEGPPPNCWACPSGTGSRTRWPSGCMSRCMPPCQSNRRAEHWRTISLRWASGWRCAPTRLPRAWRCTSGRDRAAPVTGAAHAARDQRGAPQRHRADCRGPQCRGPGPAHRVRQRRLRAPHRLFGRDEVLGQTPHMLLDLDPPCHQAARNGLRACVARRQARTELMVHRKNGAMFWVELEVVSVQATAEDVTHWVAVGRDITQRKTAEDMIRHMALYDPLTDLPNRQLLVERLQQALARASAAASTAR
jgi:PAS domain S-box-containing protein